MKIALLGLAFAASLVASQAQTHAQCNAFAVGCNPFVQQPQVMMNPTMPMQTYQPQPQMMQNPTMPMQTFQPQPFPQQQQPTSWNIIGNTAFGSNGRSCTRIGNFVNCN